MSESLILYGNLLGGSLPLSIGNLERSLQYLDISYNFFSGSIPEELYNLQLLTGLFLSSNQFTGTLSDSLGDLEVIQDLWFDHNAMSGPIPASIGNLLDLGKSHFFL